MGFCYFPYLPQVVKFGEDRPDIPEHRFEDERRYIVIP